jgi:4-nitrophenyl phosphatase
MAWLLDLDGVVWLAGTPIPGSVDAIRRLREAGERVLFVTNNSSARVAEQEAALGTIDIDAAGDVVTSAMAAARLVEPGETVHVAGGPGVVEALERRGALPVHHAARVDAVVVGLHRDFDYERLRVASGLVRDGARLVGTNDDATFPTPDGQIPGAGAILAAIAYAAGVEPTLAGKPHQPMADLVLELAGAGPHVMVGDRLSTDGAFGARLGARFALVRTGVSAGGEFADLAEAVGRLLS